MATHFGGDPTVASGMNEENIKQQIDLAAAIGAELIHCRCGLVGDLRRLDSFNKTLPPRPRGDSGLCPPKRVAFGLYGEVEGARGDWTHCSWCKEHPDWFLPNFKNIVDLTKPEVAAHVEAQLSRMIEDFKLDLYRHDYNTPFTGELGQREHDGIEEEHVLAILCGVVWNS